MTQSPAASAAAADRELVLTRVFNAPAQLVFEAWTNPTHLPHWWGPHGFTTIIKEMDVRPGGVWRLVMRGPDGRNYHNRIVFIEVDRPRRLVYKHEPEPGSEPVAFDVTVRFDAEADNKTRVTLRMLFPTAENKEYVLKTYGAEEGGKQTLARLADYLERSSALIESTLWGAK